MPSPVIGDETNSVQLWDVLFQLLPGVCCTTSRVAINNYRESLLKISSVLAPFGYLPCFHVNSFHSSLHFSPLQEHEMLQLEQSEFAGHFSWR